MTGKKLTFCLRLGTTIGLWILVLTCILSGWEFSFFVLIAGVGLAGLWEYFCMLLAAGIDVFRFTGMTCAAIFLGGSFLYLREYGPSAGHDFELAVLVCFILAVFARQIFGPRDRKPFESIVYTLFGLVYIPFLFNFLTKIVYLTPGIEPDGTSGQYYVLYLLLVTKFGDMGGYFFGLLFGKHPAVPHISPKKTWEGYAGVLFASWIGSWIMWETLAHRLDLFRPVDWFVLPVLLAFAGIIGDLAESIIKRSTNTKDSSKVLPGIGGTLDLIDSVLFTAPVLYFYMRLILHAGFER
jgi:phosphatidate cytidylyltransferase